MHPKARARLTRRLTGILSQGTLAASRWPPPPASRAAFPTLSAVFPRLGSIPALIRRVPGLSVATDRARAEALLRLQDVVALEERLRALLARLAHSVHAVVDEEGDAGDGS